WSIFFARTMDCRVISAFTRVFDAQGPAMTAPRSHLDVERDVELRRRMGDPTRGGVVDPGLGDFGDGVEGDATRGLERKLAVGHFLRLAHGRPIHVVEQYRVGYPDLEHLAQLIERIDLDLDLDQMAGGGLCALEHRGDAAGDGDVVVLDQHGVVEAEAVVETAAAADGVL